ncbi:ABC transporter ATP-binding protein [Millionella massiliensis]|uniref:ABC transporter ATP-binding protein n=1 Tax=Millionella massiliensis TaxID=1871023 RepID=UPI0008D97531|nr:ABC transporter ATP-binding protein [Millionella massiliensis]
MIEAEGISKKRGETLALDNVSLHVPRGSIHGLIGADGAGKTTLFDILVTLLRPDSGTATVGGYDILRQWHEVRNTVGYMPAVFSLYGDLSVRENLEFFAHIYRQPVDSIGTLVGDIWGQIEPFASRPAAKLSGGMKQKLALCCAMIHNPDVLMLDEPTTGVDPTSRSEFWAALRRLADQGKTVLVSTSYMDEAAKCDRITLLHRGAALDTLAPAEVTQRYRGTLYEISAADPARNSRLLRLLRDWSLSGNCYTFGDRIHLGVNLPGMRTETVVSYLRGQGIDTSLVGISPVRPTVEDFFIQLTSGAETTESLQDDNR